jgi:ribosome recycling factor
MTEHLCYLSAILDSVRVPLPDYPSPEPIVNIASITVRQNALWVEVYDEGVSRASSLSDRQKRS